MSDPYTIVVGLENRLFTIVSEYRTIDIPVEERTILIPPELRVLEVRYAPR